MDSAPLQKALAELAALYDELDAQVEASAVRCELSGLCCDFDRAGHVLYATDLEAAYARRHGAAEVPAAAPNQCPFFRGGTCRLREGRPLGCRVYYCDPAYAPRMEELAEAFHRRVVAIHERHRLPYRYAPFVRVIRESEPP